MKTSIQSFWSFYLVAFGLAFLFDQLFWKKPNGISFLLWITLATAALLIVAVVEKVRPARRSSFLAAVIIGLGIMTFVRREDLTRFLSTLVALGLLLLLVATLRTGYWTSYRLVDYLSAFFKWLWAAFSRPFGLFKKTPSLDPEASSTNSSLSSYKKIIPVLSGLVLALPILLLLTALLSSADPIFKDQIQNFFNLFNIKNLGEYLFRLFYIFIFGILFLGTLLHAILPKKEEEAPDPNKPALTPFLGFIEGTVVLLCVNFLFLLFVVIQFRYLFGGHTNITATGYTFSEYARRGFFELVTVAIIALLLYLVLAAAVKNNTVFRLHTFTVLAVWLVAQVLIMLASAWLRLQLYEAAYGFTRLRIYTHIFIPWLAILLTAAIVLEILHRRGRFAISLLACLLGFVFSFGVLNVDGLIVRLNVQRALVGEELDTNYLAELSNDAVPAMVELFTNTGLPARVHDQLAASLACRAAEAMENDSPASWTAIHYSDLTARKLYYQQKTALAAYPVSFNPKQRAYYVEVSGKSQPCPYSYIWN
ncbi:MAG: DUF4173 domain-containing protein [Anaerolineaceae bacterium]|nr:DUF4173 domain-containing protein [Anaerolineaceae bacterium]